MKVNAQLSLALILTPLFLASAHVHADTFDDAVNEYIRGYKECTEANTLRTSDLQAAKRKFDDYLKHLSKAKSIDPSIMTSKQRDMDSNLRYCERVEVNIKRAEATPILEKGFTYCDSARDALKTGDVQAANENMTEYKRYRDDAMIITDSIMEVFALSSKIRSCARVEERLAEAMRDEQKLVDKLNLAIAGYQDVNKHCQAARTLITSPGFNLSKLDEVNSLMNDASKAKKDARQNAEAFTLMEQQPNRPQSQELKKLVDSAASCEGQTSEHIRTATKNKRDLEKDITAGIASLTEAQSACDAASKASIRFTADADVAQAESDYNRSASLKKKVTADAKLLNTVKQYPDWTTSQQFSKLMNSTESCQQAAAASIKKQKAAFAQQQEKAKQEAARQTQLEKDRQLQAEEQARQEAERARAEAEKAKQEEAARRKAEKEAREAASLEDAPDGLDTEDDFGDFGDEVDSAGRDWTDLVK